jgi:Leucine-rich repeat (LRR) protein
MPGLRVEIDTKSLKYVYFENSEIESFTEDFMKELRGVEFFNANDVGLESVDGRSLGILEEMLVFWGGQNKLQRLEESAFSGNKKLKMIYLKFNRIRYIHSKAFDGLDQLYVLDISSNKLKTLDIVFDSLTSLIKLDLSHNLIEKIDKKVFKNLRNLHELNLAKNNLKHLNPKVYDPLVSLEFINISFNISPLEIITGDLFKQNFHLKQIYLIGNKIKAIDRHFLENVKSKLEIVSLRRNACVDDDVLGRNGKIAGSEMVKLRLCFDSYYED